MPESNPVPQEPVNRKARVIVTRAFGEPCPIGYKEGDAVSVDLNAPEGAFRCPGVQEALEPYLDVAQQSDAPEPMQFAASCHCPHSKSEVAFYLHVPHLCTTKLRVRSRRVRSKRLALDALTVLLFAALAAGLSATRPALGQSAEPLDLAMVLPSDDELPPGFEHQPQYDIRLEEGPVARIYRFYTRGDPEVPSDEHASILLAVTIADTIELATREFHDTIASWSRMGYGLSSFDGELGDEAVAGWDGIAGGDYPKRGALVLARFGAITATVQWVDNPNAVTLDAVVDVAQLIERRAYAAQAG